MVPVPALTVNAWYIFVRPPDFVGIVRVKGSSLLTAIPGDRGSARVMKAENLISLREGRQAGGIEQLARL